MKESGITDSATDPLADDAPVEFVPASQIPEKNSHPFADTEAVSSEQSREALDGGEGHDPEQEDAEHPPRSLQTEEPDMGVAATFRPEGVLASGCASIDQLLDGGIETDAITLVFGEAGSGKTNLALQLAREAARMGKRVAYVDTEGVSATRLAQIFGADADDAETTKAARDAQDRLLFFTPFDINQQERMVRNATLAPELGLVVVDSINMHYRLHIDGDDAQQKEANRSIVQQLHHLTTFARQKHIPVLVTGQVYGTEDGTHPFARRTMEHLVKALVRFHKTPDGARKATILKHRSIADGRQARFRIGPEGLMDADGER